MKKTIIIYESVHHKNTEKVVNYISKQLPIEVCKLQDTSNLDLKEFDLIILASGIYYNKLHKRILKWLESTDISNKEIGILYTAFIVLFLVLSGLSFDILSISCRFF